MDIGAKLRMKKVKEDDCIQIEAHHQRTGKALQALSSPLFISCFGGQMEQFVLGMLTLRGASLNLYLRE